MPLRAELPASSRLDGLPVRGPAVRELGLRLPPGRMAPLHGTRPLKRWRYLGVFTPELLLCVGNARIAGVPQRWWALALPDGTLLEGRRGVELGPGHARVRGVLDLELREGEGVEVVSPHGGAYIWTRKQAGLPVRGTLLAGGRRFELDGPHGFLDDSAGYHARHTRWRWSAGIGRSADGLSVAWNFVEGVHDAPSASERTVWVEGEPGEVPPQRFASDLSRVGSLRFREWCAREASLNLILMRNRYRQPFGSFSGELPGGLALAEGHGVMEEHDVRW